MLLTLLFQAAAETLLEFGRNNLGGKVGFTMVLHTRDQQLPPHFHVHVLMASGALADGGSRWVAGGSRFLFPVRALSKVFRAKYLVQVTMACLSVCKLSRMPGEKTSAWLSPSTLKQSLVAGRSPYSDEF